MAIHTFNPTRARQMAAIHEKDREGNAPGEFHHLRITPVDNGYVVTRHRHAGTHMPRSQFSRQRLAGLPSLASLHSAAPEEFPVTTTHVAPTLDDLHNHLDDVLGADIVHRPVGQHLAVHIPMHGTENSEAEEG